MNTQEWNCKVIEYVVFSLLDNTNLFSKEVVHIYTASTVFNGSSYFRILALGFSAALNLAILMQT